MPEFENEEERKKYIAESLKKDEEKPRRHRAAGAWHSVQLIPITRMLCRPFTPCSRRAPSRRPPSGSWCGLPA